MAGDLLSDESGDEAVETVKADTADEAVEDDDDAEEMKCSDMTWDGDGEQKKKEKKKKKKKKTKGKGGCKFVSTLWVCTLVATADGARWKKKSASGVYIFPI